MALASNLYANHIFSEHPTAIYPLDDDAGYISLINDTQRLFSAGGWTATANNGATVTLSDTPTIPDLKPPFDSNIFTSVQISNVTADDTTIELESSAIFNFEDLNQDLATFSISAFLHQKSFAINWYEFGYVFFDVSSDVYVLSRIVPEPGESWINFDFSYLPNAYDSDSMRIVLRINVDTGGLSSDDYKFVLNGLTVGQWSETTSYESLGGQVVNAPFNLQGVEVSQYGIEETVGYYIAENNRLLAKNEGIPMVYGTDRITTLYPSANESPSLIVPGNKFLFESGRYINNSVEFWMKIQPNTNQTRRIFGQVESDYGLYVQNGFLSLVVGDQIASHPVSEWYRPMLIHIVLRDNTVNLMINGEQVLSIVINREILELPSVNDWVGFYSYDDINIFQIDCISFYSYPISSAIAKRRFVYGQGVSEAAEITSAFGGTTAYIDFSNANYTANKVYPDFGNWEAGYSDNLNATRTSISAPDYQLPEVYIGGRNVVSLYTDNKVVNELENDIFFTFRPNVTSNQYDPLGEKWTEPGYFLFDSLNFVENLSSIYAVFATKDIEGYSPLFSIRNSNSQDELVVVLEDTSIKYYFNERLLYSELLTEQDFEFDYNFGYFNPYSFTYDQYGYYYPTELSEYVTFAAGIDIKKFVNSNGYQMSQFFKDRSALQMYVGGDTVNTFEQKIYSVNFCNRKNHQEIADKFYDNGVINTNEINNIKGRFGSYSLTPLVRFDRFFLDISISSAWEEYFPLSSFAGYPQNIIGNRYYDVDMMQINFSFPPVVEEQQETTSDTRWTYAELFNDYNSPVQKSYGILATPSISGYEIYEDLNFRRILEFFLNTDKNDVKTFITFQHLYDGANRPLSDFPHTKRAPLNNYIDADAENTVSEEYKAYLTKFEFVDKTIIFPPKKIDFEKIAMVVHFVVNQTGILSNPLRIRELEVSSRALNQYDFNPIGTEFGVPIYPYVRSGIYFDNKRKNPLLISKKPYPYLYLTEDSGITLLHELDLNNEYAAAMPININKSEVFDVSAFQLWFKYNQSSFPPISLPRPIFEIQYSDRTVEFIIKQDASGNRGVIGARDKLSKLLINGITYYQNGVKVKEPIVELNQWNSLGIQFNESISFAFDTGYLVMLNGSTFNNVSFFSSPGMLETTKIGVRNWLQVYQDFSTNDIFNWTAWYIEGAGSTQTRTNLIPNPSIETSINGWSATGSGISLTADNSYSNFGSSSLKVVVSGSNNAGVIYGSDVLDRISVTGQTEYTVSAFAKVPPGGIDKVLRFRIREFSSSGSSLGIIAGSSVLVKEENGWLRFFYTFTTSTDTESIAVEISQQLNNVVGSIHYIDGVLLEETQSFTDKNQPYFDGSIASGAMLIDSLVWSGTPHNSSSTAVFYAVDDVVTQQWRDVYVTNEVVSFDLTPKDIYQNFVGTNRILIDDDDTLGINLDELASFSSVVWSTFEDKPA